MNSKYFKIPVFFILSIFSGMLITQYWRLPKNDLLHFVMAGLVYFLLCHVEQVRYLNKREKIGYTLFSIFFGLSIVLGYHINVLGNYYFGLIDEHYIIPYRKLDIIAWIILSGVTFLSIVYLAEKFKKYSSKFSLLSDFVVRKKYRYLLIFAGIMFVCWMPYFLANYPGFILPDAVWSLMQADGRSPLNNHHPILYTLFLKLCVFLGSVFGHITHGVAVYSILQMIILSLGLSRVIFFLRYDLGVKKVFCYLTLAYFSLLPFFGQISIVLWKDPIFSVVTVLFSISLYLILFKKSSVFILITYALIMVFTRNNGTFVLLLIVASFLMLAVFKKIQFQTIKQTVIGLLFVVLVHTGITKIGYPMWNVEQGPKVESYGIFLNQMASVAAYQGNLNEEEKQYLSEMLPLESYRYVYRPTTVDMLKWDVNFDKTVLERENSPFFKYYLSIGVKNKKHYFNAWQILTFGYWAPNFWEFYADGNNIVKGNLNDFAEREFGIKNKNLLTSISSVFETHFTPFGHIMPLGQLIWVVLFLIIIAVIYKNYSYLAVLLPSVAVMVTLLIASPYYYWQRYGLVLYYLLPIVIAIFFKIKNEDSVDNIQKIRKAMRRRNG